MSLDKDISPPKLIKEYGAHHQINYTKDSIIDLLKSLGFHVINGPEIESEKYNFDMLNINAFHLQDKCMIHFMLIKKQTF